MSNLNVGDIVRIGKGKVEYVVSKIVNEPNDLGTYAVEVESMNTGKAQVIEAARLTLLRSAETEPLNAPQSVTVELVEEETGEAFDVREDRRQSDYGLSILAALLRKDPRAGMTNSNALKPIGSKRPKVRARIKSERTRFHAAGKRYNDAVRLYGAYTPNAA